MGRLEGRVRRLEAKATPFEAIRVLVAFMDLPGAPLHVLIDGGMRPATAAEVSGDGAGCVVTMREEDLNL